MREKVSRQKGHVSKSRALIGAKKRATEGCEFADRHIGSGTRLGIQHSACECCCYFWLFETNNFLLNRNLTIPFTISGNETFALEWSILTFYSLLTISSACLFSAYIQVFSIHHMHLRALEYQHSFMHPYADLCGIRCSEIFCFSFENRGSISSAQHESPWEKWNKKARFVRVYYF